MAVLAICTGKFQPSIPNAAKGMPPIGSSVMTPEGLGKVCNLHFMWGKVSVKMEDGKTKEFAKGDIEMVDADAIVPADQFPLALVICQFVKL